MDRLLRRSPSSFARRIPLVCAAIAIALAAPVRAEQPVHIRNFGRVDSTLYRGAEPTPLALQELQQLGVKLIIDLRQSGTATLRERDEAQQLHIQYVNIPLPPLSAPSSGDVRRILVLLENRGSAPVFVHCRRGKDRTGTIIACYRMQHDGWSSTKALTEAQEYGMSWTERAMRNFVLHFTPFPKDTLDLAGAGVLSTPAH
ncbi:MAG TPA: tyrosine-protein phosphatase [Bryobacteraceae bacterium]|jgi:protein tyrosine/serine phosphatase|nr:tyrosine-protein phosphatase [Bryobacteraceae bacterium]